MTVRIGILTEQAPGETRVALVPEVVQRLVQRGGAVLIESGAGVRAQCGDAAYTASGAQIATDRRAILETAHIVCCVQAPSLDELTAMPAGSILIGLLRPHQAQALIQCCGERRITSCALERIPRTSRAQRMDVLSSQATVAGYRAALVAAHLSARFFPMLTTAAGTLRPARVLVLGAGVAGLQAIATARRLGAIVEAYDVRAAAREEVESLGARFCGLAINACTPEGYARSLTPEERLQEQTLVAEHVRRADVVITTAQIPGRPAPRLISAELVAQMSPGAVIVDLAAEGGGNCACTVPGETVEVHGVRIAGPLNLPAALPAQASAMYAKNLWHFLELLITAGGELAPDWEDDILAATLLTRDGRPLHEAAHV